MIEIYKLRNFLYDKEASNGLIELSHWNHRGNNIQLKTRNSKLNLRKTLRVVNDWNHPPASAVYSHLFNWVFDRKFLRKLPFCVLLKQSNTRSKLEIFYMLFYLIYQTHLTHFHTIFFQKPSVVTFSSSTIQIVESFCNRSIATSVCKWCCFWMDWIATRSSPRNSQRAVIFKFVCEWSSKTYERNCSYITVGWPMLIFFYW